MAFASPRSTSHNTPMVSVETLVTCSVGLDGCRGSVDASNASDTASFTVVCLVSSNAYARLDTSGVTASDVRYVSRASVTYAALFIGRYRIV